MTVFPLNTQFVKLYSKGIEEKYNGTNIIYNNSSNTFLFFYYSKYTVVYVINGIKKDFQLVQVKEKINRIAIYQYTDARRFIKFFNKVLNEDDFIFFIPPLFFRECSALINKKRYMSYLEMLYRKYKEEIKNKKYFPDF